MGNYRHKKNRMKNGFRCGSIKSLYNFPRSSVVKISLKEESSGSKSEIMLLGFRFQIRQNDPGMKRCSLLTDDQTNFAFNDYHFVVSNGTKEVHQNVICSHLFTDDNSKCGACRIVF